MKKIIPAGKNNMSTFYLPWGDHNTASSRLRVFNIGPLLQDTYIGCPPEYKKGDVLIIQKTPDRDEMKKAQSQGAKVVYDLDDHYWDKAEFKSMLRNADMVTVDTEEKQRILDFRGNKSQLAVVIPDSLDWDGISQEKPLKNGIIGWTGYGNSSHYLKDLNLQKEYTLRLITSPDWYKGLPDPEAKIQCRPWSLDMVDHYLRECEMIIFPLPGDDFDQVKGMHKLLKAWANRIPCYTSRMPDYVKAMKEAGVGEKYLVDDWSKLKNIGFDEKCYEYAMRFKSELIAPLWQKAIDQVLKTK